MEGTIRVLIILLTCPHVNLYQKTCDVPTYDENGFFEMPHRGTGGTVTYKCFEGYWYTGTKTRTCQANGQWSGIQGYCQVVQCPMLDDPTNGKVEITGKKFRDKATVKCNEGYIYSDPEVNQQICQGDNTWTSRSGECLGVRCPDIPTVQHGEIAYSGRGYKDKANIICNEGYVYTKPESATRTCQGDNTWSLEFDGKCRYITCTTVQPPLNGNLSTTKTHYGTNITITCLPGYTLQGAYCITCQDTGMWSDSPGNCIKEPWNRSLLWLIAVPIVTIAVIFLIVKRRHLKKALCKTRVPDNVDRHSREDEPFLSQTVKGPPSPTSVPRALRKSEYHCSFVLEDELEAELSNTESPEYVRFTSKIRDGVQSTLLDHGTTAVVHVTCVSPIKRAVFMDIECKGQLTEADMRSTFMSTEKGFEKHNINITTDTLIFRDDISNAIAMDTIKKNHVPRYKDRKIDFLSQYVNLKVLSQQELTTITRDEIERPHNSLSDMEHNKTDRVKDKDVICVGDVMKYVLVRGRAGIGKTTLMQRLMWKWAHGEWAKHFKAFFLLNLRILMSMTTEMSLPELLSECAVYRVAASHKTLGEKWLLHNQKNVGFILDGLDEVTDFSRLWDKVYEIGAITDKRSPLFWAFCLMKRECIKSSTIIVTSRPFVALSKIKDLTTKMIEVMGLTRERIMEFVEQNVSSARKTMVKQALRNSPILLSVSSITFYCASLCQVLGDDISNYNKLTTYSQITAYIIQMYIHRTFENKTLPANLTTSLRSLCRLAYGGLIKRNHGELAELVFDSKDFQAHNIQQSDVDTARQTGLFLQTEVPDQTDSEKKQILGEFVHLCIQEFLAMAGLLMESPRDIKKALNQLCTSGQFNMGLLFLYGLSYNTTSEAMENLKQTIGGPFELEQEVYVALKNAILAKRVMLDLIQGIEDNLQVLQMVHESQSPEIAQAVGEKKFPKEVKFAKTKLTVVDFLAITFLLKHHSQATTINLKDVGLDDVSCQELAHFIQFNSTVTALELYDDAIGNGAVKHFVSAFKENKTVRKLVMESKSMKDPAMGSIADALRTNTGLTDLRIQAVNATDLGIGQLADALASNSTLTSLKIVSNVKDASMTSFANVLKRNDALTDITIVSSGVSSLGVTLLATALENNRSLKSLRLQWAAIDDEAADRLLTALDMNKIETVGFIYPDCDQDVMVKLQENKRIKITSV